MASRELSRRAGLAGALVIVAALVVAISLIEFLVDEAYRPAAMRLLAAAVLLVAVVRILAVVRASIERLTAWGVDGAGGRAAAPRSPDARFERFHDEIRFSARSHSYFEHILWPRLVALARADAGAPRELDKPPGRRLGRGPSLGALARLIASLESRR